MNPVRLTSECPMCGDPLVARKNRREGTLFLGCSAYPACRFTEEVIPALEQVLSQTKNQTAASPTLAEVNRRIRQTIAIVHPDKWQGAPLATEVTRELNDLRAFIAGESRRD